MAGALRGSVHPTEMDGFPNQRVAQLVSPMSLNRKQSVYLADAEAVKGLETFIGINDYKYWIEPKGP